MHPVRQGYVYLNMTLNKVLLSQPSRCWNYRHVLPCFPFKNERAALEIKPRALPAC